MKKHLSLFVMLIALGGIIVGMANLRPKQISPRVAKPAPEYLLVIHGGAGDITRDQLHGDLAAQYYDALHAALIIGYRILDSGGSSLDAVEAVVMYMEDCPLFNAGRGAVFTSEGKHELDASVMDGSTGMAGAVAGVTTVKHPVSAARAVMEKSEHVMLAGRGADLFAAEQGLEIVDPSWFFTQERYEGWKRAKEKINKKGTVGAVALDKKGNLAAATSTGGMSMKRYGRVGDAPVIGAGTFASNATCGVSCTGHGEYFIRNAVAHDLSARMAYQRTSLRDAAHQIVQIKLKQQGGTGGLIAIDKRGNYVMEFNTKGMFRGVLLPGGEIHAMIFDDERFPE